MMITYLYEDVLRSSLLYFDGDELAAKVYVDKYALRNAESELVECNPEQTFWRLAKEFARIEKKKFKNPLTEQQIFDYLNNFKYIILAGSPTFGIGNNFQTISLSNCFLVESPQDSYSSIIKSDEQFANICKRRGGVGICLDNLRPEGFITNNAAKTSTGIISFMERFSNTIKEVCQCISKGEYVLTKRGMVKIEDCQISDKVWTKKGWISINNIFQNGKKEIYTVKTKRGYEIKTSIDHIFCNSKDGEIVEKPLKDFSIGDDIILIPGQLTEADYITLIDNEYEKSNYNNSNRLNENIKIPTILDEKLSYFLGYSYGNGYAFNNNQKNDKGLQLACPWDQKEIQEKLLKYCKELFSIDMTVREGGGKVNKVTLYSAIIMNFLKNNNLLKQKAGSLIFPENIIKSKSSVQMAFISGFFDADGCSQKSKKVYKMSSIDKDFIRNIQNVLMANGIISTIYSYVRNNKKWNDIYNLSINGKCFQDKFYNIMTESIKVQSNIFHKLYDRNKTPFKIKNLEIVNKSKWKNSIRDNFINSEYYYLIRKENPELDQILITDEIIEINKENELLETYDLSLDSENLFWCNGFYVHNSGRRGASIQLLSVHHPQIIDFATVKNDDKKVTGSNISVKLTDEFLNAVKNDEDYELRFPVDYKEKNIEPKFSKMINAREIWNIIIHSAWLRAEPGLLFWDTITRNTPADSYDEYKSKGANPCSELNLSELDSCRLISENLYSFVDNPFTSNASFNYSKFSEVTRIAQRMMDDLVDLESEKIEQIIAKIKSDPEDDHIKVDELRMWTIIKKHNDEGRRTGLGLLGLADTMAALGICYGSDESVSFSESIAKTLKLAAYRESVEMAKEIGPFKCYDSELEKDNVFIKRIAEEDPELYNDMKKYGRRNISLTTIAPTGSISILARTSSGLEPCFNLSYTRRKKINDNDKTPKVDFVDKEGVRWQNFEVFHPKINEWMKVTGEKDISKSPWFGCTADNINWMNRVKIQGRLQKHICHSISSCIVAKTLIETSEGLLYVDEIFDFKETKPNEFVENNNFDGFVLNENLEDDKITHFYNNGIKPVFKVKLCNNLEIEATGNEKLIYLNETTGLEEWKEISSLVIGDLIKIK